MKILVEILHPAHVHVFRNAIHEWRKRGDDVLVLSREKECANDLLDLYSIPYHSISKISDKKTGLFTEMAVRDVRMWQACRRFNPDVLTGIMGVTIAQVGKLIRKPAVVFYDTENAKLTNRIVYPLAHSVCTPDCYQAPVKGHHITYPGYHELAYLHPNRFTPDPDIVKKAGLSPDKPYFILRFVSWQASHDINEKGLSSAFKKNVLEILQPYGRVLISSEGALPVELEPFRFQASPADMHHIMAYASILIGESATMASEAAVLGIPAFFISDTGRGYTDEEESRYGLVFNYKTAQTSEAIEKIHELLSTPNRQEIFQRRRQKLLDEKNDTTAWIITYIDSVVREVNT